MDAEQIKTSTSSTVTHKAVMRWDEEGAPRFVLPDDIYPANLRGVEVVVSRAFAVQETHVNWQDTGVEYPMNVHVNAVMRRVLKSGKIGSRLVHLYQNSVPREIREPLTEAVLEQRDRYEAGS